MTRPTATIVFIITARPCSLHLILSNLSECMHYIHYPNNTINWFPMRAATSLQGRVAQEFTSLQCLQLDTAVPDRCRFRPRPKRGFIRTASFDIDTGTPSNQHPLEAKPDRTPS
jgi:hypothetical protein